MSVYGIKAQNGIIQGTVLNEKEEPMGNVTIRSDQGGEPVFTDASGHFILANLNAGNVKITASFVGYDDLVEINEIAATDRLSIILKMHPKIDVNKDIVIIGYARQLKKDVTGNISKVRGNELTINPGLSLDAALQGKAPGIQVVQSGGVAGAGALIRVRGIASISANGEPLYILDGIPINQDPFIQIGRGISGNQNNPLSFLNIQDVESIEILKDAAAAGIYGSRGANGIVYITTKQHKVATPNRLSVISSFGTSSPTILLKMANSSEYLQLYQEAWENDGNTGKALLPDGISWDEAQKNNTDWVKELTRLGLKNETNIQYSFGQKKSRVFLGLGYLNAQSYLLGNNFRRFSGRFNVETEITNKTKLKYFLTASQSLNNRQSQSVQGGLGAAYSTALPIFSTDRITGFGTTGNPLLRMKYQDWSTTETRLIQTLSLETEVLRNVFWENKVGFDHQNLFDNYYMAKEFSAKDGVLPADQKSVAQLKDYTADNLLVNSTLTFYLRKNAKTDLSFLVGTEAQNAWISTYTVEQLGTNLKLIHSETNGAQNAIAREAWSFLSYFSRFNAKLLNKFLLQGSYRIDGSSRFGINNRFGQFPALAAGYLMNEEPWMRNSKVFSLFKMRGGWGYVGSSSIPNFVAWGLYGNPPSGNTYNNQPIMQPLNIANPNLRWEMCRVADAGIEIAMFKNRLYLEVSAYDRLTKDVLIDSRIPSSSGIPNANGEFRYFTNAGKISNKGIEFLFNAYLMDRNAATPNKRFLWSIKLNGMRNVNKVLEIGYTDPDAIVGGGETRILNNYPVGVFYLVRYAGVDPNTGKPMFYNKEGNKTSVYNLKDRVVVGDVQPDFVGFFENRFDIGKLMISASLYGVYGGKIYDEAARRQLTMLGNSNVSADIFNRWQQSGNNADFAKLTFDPLNYGGLDNVSNYHSSQWLYDASYLRLREIAVRYQLKSANQDDESGIAGATITFSIYNLWLWSKYPGDPEIIRDYSIAASRNISPNVANLNPPQERSFMLTLKVDF